MYTYRELLSALLELSEEELDMTATVYDAALEWDTYYPITSTDKTVELDVLDEGHPVIVINDLADSHISCKPQGPMV